MEALVPESSSMYHLIDALEKDDREVHRDENKDDYDAGPAAEVPRFRLWYKLREHDQMVGANDDQDFVDELERASHATHKRLEVADVDHDKAALEDHRLHLEVVTIDPVYQHQSVKNTP